MVSEQHRRDSKITQGWKWPQTNFGLAKIDWKRLFTHPLVVAFLNFSSFAACWSCYPTCKVFADKNSVLQEHHRLHSSTFENNEGFHSLQGSSATWPGQNRPAAAQQWFDCFGFVLRLLDALYSVLSTTRSSVHLEKIPIPYAGLVCRCVHVPRIVRRAC